MTEADLQQAVIDLARTFAWRVAHFRPARTQHGWRTPVAADGAGWPDLTLVGNGRVMFVELKSDVGKLTEDQEAWRDALVAAGAEWRCWRPTDWPAIVAELSGGRAS